MTAALTFELHRYGDGRWTIDSVYDDREMAVYECRQLLRNRHVAGARVVEERCDAESGRTTSRIIFQERRGKAQAQAQPRYKVNYPSPTQAPKPEERPAQRATVQSRPTPRQPVPPRRSFISYVVFLILSVGAVGLAAIFVLMALLSYFG